MSKNKTYLYIITIALITIALGFLLNIHLIKSGFSGTLLYIQSSTLPALAAICAFLFYGNKNYWWTILGCGIIAAIILPFINGANEASLYAIIYRCLAFMTVVFLMNFIKLIINRK